MFLPFSANRRLCRIAADAARIEASAASDSQPWRRSADELVSPGIAPGTGRGDDLVDDRMRLVLEAAMEVAVVGGADELERLLTEDAVSVSPTQAFVSRAQAVEARADHTSTLVVVDFDVTRLVWTDCLVVAEWCLLSTQGAPLLVGDDVLVEGTDRPITLSGVTVAERRGDRFSAVRTYFDEADLIEQVLLGS